MADDADRLGLLEERAHEAHGVLVHPQEVGVGHAARQHQAVVVGRVRVLGGLVDGERVRLVEVVERLHLAVLDRDELRRAAGLLDRLPGLRQLHLLDALGGQERDLLAVQFITHTAAATRPRRRFTPMGVG